MEKKNKGEHQHLLMKQLKNIIKENNLNFKKKISQMQVDYDNIDQEQRRYLLTSLIEQIKQTEQGQSLIKLLMSKIVQQAECGNSSLVRRNGYVIDCFREATIFPIIKERDIPIINLNNFHGEDIGKQLRRVVWSRTFNIISSKSQFGKWDREITPYRVTQDLRASMQQIKGQLLLNLKESQIEIAIKILEYFTKSRDKVPQKYHYLITLLVVDLYCYVPATRVHEVGAVVVGIAKLIEFYRQDNSELRLTRIKQALQIIDQQTLLHLQKYYFNQQIQGDKQLMAHYQLFRLSFGSSILNCQICQFMVDQLIIRKKCRVDMYTMFAIVILMISDQFILEGEQPTLSSVILSARNIIKLQDFITVYNTIYEQVPVFHHLKHLKTSPNHKLLSHMLASQSQEQLPSDYPSDFIIDIQTKPRIGYKDQ